MRLAFNCCFPFGVISPSAARETETLMVEEREENERASLWPGFWFQGDGDAGTCLPAEHTHKLHVFI